MILRTKFAELQKTCSLFHGRSHLLMLTNLMQYYMSMFILANNSCLFVNVKTKACFEAWQGVTMNFNTFDAFDVGWFLKFLNLKKFENGADTDIVNSLGMLLWENKILEYTGKNNPSQGSYEDKQTKSVYMQLQWWIRNILYIKMAELTLFFKMCSWVFILVHSALIDLSI